MEEMKENPQEVKKLSYEELSSACHTLSEQARTLYQKLQEANLANAFKRLDYLFTVVNNRMAFSDSFVDKCIKEIEETLTVEENKESEDK